MICRTCGNCCVRLKIHSEMSLHCPDYFVARVWVRARDARAVENSRPCLKTWSVSWCLHERLREIVAVPLLLPPAWLWATHWSCRPSSRSGAGVKVQVPVTLSSLSHLSVSQVYTGAGFTSVDLQVKVKDFLPSAMKVPGPLIVVCSSSGPSGVRNFRTLK